MASLLLDSSLPKSNLGNLYNGRENVSPFKIMGNVVFFFHSLTRFLRRRYLKFFALQDINSNCLPHLKLIRLVRNWFSHI